MSSLDPVPQPDPVDLSSLSFPAERQPEEPAEGSTGRAANSRQAQIMKAIAGTLPRGAALQRISFSERGQGRNLPEFVIVRVSHSKASADAVRAWESTLSDKIDMPVLVEATGTSGLYRQLERISDKDGVVRDEGKVLRCMRRVHGSANGIAAGPGPELPIDKAVDLTEKKFFTVDPRGARDLDDALCAEPLGNGRIRLYISFADVSWRIQPGSDLALYAFRAGYTLYGRNTNLPLLGEDISCRELSLLQDNDRLAWTMQIDLNKDGTIAGRQVFRALIRSRRQLDYSEAQTLLDGAQDDISPELCLVREAAHRLRSERFNLQVDPDTVSETRSRRMVEEAMICGKSTIAELLYSSDVPILYRVVGPPSRAVKQHLVQEIRASGIEASKADFSDSWRLAKLLCRLRDAGENELFHSVVDLHRGDARYELFNRGHSKLNVEAYADGKGLRGLPGVVTQWQLAHLICGEPAIDEKELKRLEKQVNRLERALPLRYSNFLTLESIHETLQSAGKSFSARPQSAGPQGLALHVPGLRFDGIIPLKEMQALTEPLPASLNVILDGYSPLLRRFVFKVDTSENFMP